MTSKDEKILQVTKQKKDGPLIVSACNNAKAEAKLYRLKDTNGLYLEVKPSGNKVWRYRFEMTQDGKRSESMYTIGDYAYVPIGKETDEEAEERRKGCAFTLHEARKERDKVRALVRQGINPNHHKQLERIKREQDFANTFEAIARNWIQLRDWEDVTKKRRLDMLERVVFPHIGKLPIRQVTSLHVLDILKKADKDNGPSVKDEAKRTMSAIFEFAVSNLMAEGDPVYLVRRALLANKTQHKKALTLEEVGELLRAIAGYERNFQVVAAFQIMWLTLCRPSEAVGMRWDEIDFDKELWHLPASRMKNRKEHTFPLPRQAIEVLESMKNFTGHRPHVFPHRDKRDEAMTDNAFRQAMKNLGWSGRYSPHATRTTGSTHLNGMGFNADWIERQLAHTDKNGVRRTYNHADYIHQRRDMMQQWADMLDTLRDGGQVVVGNFGKAVNDG